MESVESWVAGAESVLDSFEAGLRVQAARTIRTGARRLNRPVDAALDLAEGVRQQSGMDHV
jgi:hypothetical protein